MEKVTIIGAGNVGTAAAFYLAENKVSNVLLIDTVEGLAKGKALDLMEAAPIRGYDVYVDGSDHYEDMKGSKVVVIAAGSPRKPEMLRLDLLEQNIKIIDHVVAQISAYAPDATIINLTEPVDSLTYYILKKNGFKAQKVMGVTGVLDSARLRKFIAKELDVSIVDTTAIVIGGHHDYMVIPPRYARVEGIPITELMPRERVDNLIERTRNAGKEIVDLLKTGSASSAPGAAVAELVEAIVRDTEKILCVAAYLNGEYGYKDICLGVPALLGKNGIKRIVEIELTLTEKEALDKSAAVVQNVIKTLDLNKSR
jgi:malate dehydrogenase